MEGQVRLALTRRASLRSRTTAGHDRASNATDVRNSAKMWPVGWDALEQWGDDVARIEPLTGGVANDGWSVRVNGHLAVGRLGARSDADLAWAARLALIERGGGAWRVTSCVALGRSIVFELTTCPVSLASSCFVGHWDAVEGLGAGTWAHDHLRGRDVSPPTRRVEGGLAQNRGDCGVSRRDPRSFMRRRRRHNAGDRRLGRGEGRWTDSARSCEQPNPNHPVRHVRARGTPGLRD